MVEIMTFSYILATVLVLNLIVTIIFVLKTKSQSSKMLIALLFSNTGVGVLVLLFDVYGIDSFLDIALMIVLLSSVSAIVFAKRLRYKD
jgi:multisubunit Na+/H+ antiporter MnhF subunit